MKKNKKYICSHCKGNIIFETKKTFAIPDIKHGICEKCFINYILIDGDLKEEKDGTGSNYTET